MYLEEVSSAVAIHWRWALRPWYPGWYYCRTPVKKIATAAYKITFDNNKKVTKMPKTNGFC